MNKHSLKKSIKNNALQLETFFLWYRHARNKTILSRRYSSIVIKLYEILQFYTDPGSWNFLSVYILSNKKLVNGNSDLNI